MRPAEVIGSWATTQPAGSDGGGHAPQHDHGGVDHVQEEEPAEGQVDRLGQAQVLAGLGDGQHLAVGGRRRGHLVPGGRVGVDGVDAAVVADDLGQGDRHVAPAGADVDAGPARADPQPVEGGGQGPPVDVVPQAAQFHRPHVTGSLRCRRLRADRALGAPDRTPVVAGGPGGTGSLAFP